MGMVDEAQFKELVDIMLIEGGASRDELYEYPYNTYESKDRVKKAEAAAHKALKALGLKPAF